jgi:single-stranded-DNA-specific exonuclease
VREAPTIVRRPVDGSTDDLPVDLHPVIRRILRARNVTDAQALDLTMGRMLSPSTLGGIGPAAEMLADAITGDQSILIVGDFDADGATGTAVAILAIRAMGGRRVDFRVPNRFEFGYGLTVPLVEALGEGLPDILVTVDSGISSNDGVNAANQRGCKVIVTDHHLPGEVLPAAAAIVNPNCEGDAFPSKALAGVGVMFYLLGSVRKVLRERNWFGPRRPEPNLASFLDLVALGTVADLVPLDHNNRILIRQGLERIRRGMTRPGLLAMLKLGKRDFRYLQASDLGFAVGPRLNAAGRLDDMSVGIRCLLTDDPQEAMDYATTLDDLNRRRKTMQEGMQEDALQQVATLVSAIDKQALPSALCLYQQNWHQGIVGLVASKVKDVVHRPVVAFAPEAQPDDPSNDSADADHKAEEAGTIFLKGSARSVRGLHIRDAMARVDATHPGLIRAFGGHAMAAGLTLDADHYEVFQDALSQAVDELLDGASLTAEIYTDGELGPADIGLNFARELESLGPWGQRFPEPVFEGSFTVIDQRIVGQKHLKMIVRPAQGGTEVDAIAFNYLPEDLDRRSSFNCLYRLDINRWRGNEDCQLMIEKIY